MLKLLLVGWKILQYEESEFHIVPFCVSIWAIGHITEKSKEFVVNLVELTEFVMSVFAGVRVMGNMNSLQGGPMNYAYKKLQ